MFDYMRDRNTKMVCDKEGGNCLKEVNSIDGEYLCGECNGCSKCCTCDNDWQEEYLDKYGSFANCAIDKEIIISPRTLLEKRLEKEEEWEKKVIELRSEQIA